MICITIDIDDSFGYYIVREINTALYEENIYFIGGFIMFNFIIVIFSIMAVCLCAICIGSCYVIFKGQMTIQSSDYYQDILAKREDKKFTKEYRKAHKED